MQMQRLKLEFKELGHCVKAEDVEFIVPYLEPLSHCDSYVRPIILHVIHVGYDCTIQSTQCTHGIIMRDCYEY